MSERTEAVADLRERVAEAIGGAIEDVGIAHWLPQGGDPDQEVEKWNARIEQIADAALAVLRDRGGQSGLARARSIARQLADEDNWTVAAGMDKEVDRPPLMYGHDQPWELGRELVELLDRGGQPPAEPSEEAVKAFAIAYEQAESVPWDETAPYWAPSNCSEEREGLRAAYAVDRPVPPAEQLTAEEQADEWRGRYERAKERADRAADQAMLFRESLERIAAWSEEDIKKRRVRAAPALTAQEAHDEAARSLAAREEAEDG